jgi:hypothetical protein
MRNTYLFSRGGSLISQTKEIAKDASGFVCPNASCRKIFTIPLEATNVQVSKEPYKACPFCLTKITGDPEIISNIPPKEEIPAAPIEANNKKEEDAASSPGCSKHFGFLSERAANVPIPDECLTCSDVVQCMRKKTKD